MYGYYDEQREAWIEVNEETQEATVKAYNETGEEILNQTFSIRKHGGKREGAGRPQDSAKAHTREPLYQEGYNAGYQAGKRAAENNFPTPNEETLLDEAGQPYALLHWGYCPTCGQKNAWKSFTIRDTVDSVVEACQCVSAQTVRGKR